MTHAIWLMALVFIVTFAGAMGLFVRSIRRDRARYGPLLGSAPAPAVRAGCLRALVCLAILPIVWLGVAAAIRPFLHRPWVFCLWEAFLIFGLWTLLLIFSVWLWSRRAAGAVLLDLRPAPNRTLLLVSGGFFLIMTGLSAVVAVVAVLFDLNSEPFPVGTLVMGLMIGGGPVLMGISRLQIREGGIVVYTDLIRWGQIRQYEWAGTDGNSLMLNPGGSGSGVIPIPSKDKESVDRILKERVQVDRGVSDGSWRRAIGLSSFALVLLVAVSGGWLMVLDWPRMVLSTGGENVECLAYSPDGRTLAGGAGRQVLLWDCETREIVKTFSGHEGLVISLAFSPGGERLASGSEDQTVRVWDVASGQLETTLTKHRGAVGGVAFLGNGERLASVSNESTVHIWNAETGKVEESFESPIGFVNSRTGKVKKSFDNFGRLAIAVAPNGNLIAAPSGGRVKLIDSRTGEFAVTLQPSRYPLCLEFTPDGAGLIGGDLKGGLKLWDVETGGLKTKFDLKSKGDYGRAYSVSVSPDGRIVATRRHRRNEFELWTVATGKRSGAVGTYGGNVRCVAFAPDGKLAVANSDATVAIWSIPD